MPAKKKSSRKRTFKRKRSTGSLKRKSHVGLGPQANKKSADSDEEESDDTIYGGPHLVPDE